jgi:4-diphosphocytidyl-2-C-methyl-D-erythritol kinase
VSALTELAPAKINLGLTLGPQRGDGRHEIATLMQPVALCDRVRLVPAPLGSARDEVHCPGVSGDNLALAALAAFRSSTGWDGAPVRIEIDKRIPVAAGMAGGSADAGAVLRLAARAAGRRELLRDDGLLREIAAGLGSDVPAQVSPGRYLATGAGEQLHALPDVPPFGVLIVRSGEGLSTADVYREADRLGLPRSAAQLEARRAELVAALAAGARMPPRELLVNDLEQAAASLRPELADTLEEVRRLGADHAMVCGSGPTVAGLFPDLERARAAGVALSGRRPAPIAVEPWYPALAPLDEP